jgi:hypothetical protein
MCILEQLIGAQSIVSCGATNKSTRGSRVKLEFYVMGRLLSLKATFFNMIHALDVFIIDNLFQLYFPYTCRHTHSV